MKAKEIIKLYEDEDKLSSDEIAELINGYFIKKCKSIGMKINYLNSPFPSSASLTVASQVSFGVSQEQKYFKQYLKKVSDIIKKNNVNVIKSSSTLDVYLPHAVSSTWMDEYIFYISLYLYDSDVVVEFYKSPYLNRTERPYYLNRTERKDELSDYEEFSSELKLSEVYRLIDVMVKAIRLTPFEE